MQQAPHGTQNAIKHVHMSVKQPHSGSSKVAIIASTSDDFMSISLFLGYIRKKAITLWMRGLLRPD
jgi:hypothetical protein